ncbi:hypothetical protein [Dyadobacter sp. BHUBP1]|uniref:hypothetical protein n=1 Tax=Dyadobacter sp. BHUBP1 TaxID=3424178 RepID=UPI003D338ED7
MKSYSEYQVEPEGIVEFGYLTIKDRLLRRFVPAKAVLGISWRRKIMVVDPFFLTEKGIKFMMSTAQAVSDQSRGNVDRIERVVIAMEKAAGIEIETVV